MQAQYTISGADNKSLQNTFARSVQEQIIVQYYIVFTNKLNHETAVHYNFEIPTMKKGSHVDAACLISNKYYNFCTTEQVPF